MGKKRKLMEILTFHFCRLLLQNWPRFAVEIDELVGGGDWGESSHKNQSFVVRHVSRTRTGRTEG